MISLKITNPFDPGSFGLVIFREIMCLQTAPWTQATQVANVSNRKLDSAVVEEILQNAAQASLEAPNRALKRRVRQRLHKKLGSMLTCEEFGRAMERYKEMEASNEASTTPTPASSPVVATPAPQAFIVQMPFLMPMMQMVPAPAPVQRYMPLEGLTGPTAPVEMKAPTAVVSVASESTMDDDDTISELSVEWQRATTLGSGHLPVERTFIQFDTRMHIRHRRSRSV